MNLAHPDEVDEPDQPEHPITGESVETALQMSDADIPVKTLHDRLETVQAAFEHDLTGQMQFFDPLDQFGEVVHGITGDMTDTPYRRHLYMEDGKHGFDNKWQRRAAIAAKKAADKPGDEVNTDEFGELVDSVDLEDYTEEEQYEAFGMKLGVWDEVARLLDLNRDDAEFKAVKFAHELAYKDSPYGHTTYGTTGFVVGIPDMFIGGMHTERRVFSAFVESTKLPPAQLIDAYGNRVSYSVNSKWASKRGVSESAVSQNRTKARNALREKYDNLSTIPDNLF